MLSALATRTLPVKRLSSIQYPPLHACSCRKGHCRASHCPAMCKTASSGICCEGLFLAARSNQGSPAQPTFINDMHSGQTEGWSTPKEKVELSSESRLAKGRLRPTRVEGMGFLPPADPCSPRPSCSASSKGWSLRRPCHMPPLPALPQPSMHVPRSSLILEQGRVQLEFHLAVYQHANAVFLNPARVHIN